MTRQTNPFLLFMLLLLLAVGLVAGCSDDDDDGITDPGDEPDTTAPQVLNVEPDDGETGIAVDAAIVITFSEDMDTGSADGQIALSSGTVTDVQWTDARTLTVAHDDWAEGATVTVTVGTGLSDEAGNALPEAYTFTFYVLSTDLVFIDSNPVDGAVDVNRSVVISLLFSAEMNETSFANATTLTDGEDNPIAFDVHEGQGSWMIVDPVADLPADEQITLNVSTDAQDMGGRNLAAPVSITFTTGQDVDTTPPTIVSFEPANGAEVDPETALFRVTFSEPVIPDDAMPVRVNAELFWIAEEGGAEPTLSPDGTVLTIPLPTPLPDGLPMEITFQGYRDQAGNPQETATTWTATVEGTADYYPLEDGRRFIYDEYEEGGTVGNDTPEWNWSGEGYIQFVAAGGGVFHRGWYDPDFTTVDDWDVMRQSGGALQYLGFHESDDGDELDIVFDDPIDYVTLPPAGTWTSTTTATIAGAGTITLVGEGRFVEELDLPWLPGDGDYPELFWKDVRLVILEHTISAGDDLMESGVDSLWLSPTVGLVRYATDLEDHMENEWSWEHGELVPPQD
jgi:hypothetical protein